MGAKSDASDCSEFVEVDPSGRYGRVTSLIHHMHHFPSIHFLVFSKFFL